MVFSDIQNHWAYNCIYKLENLEIIKGYPDGTFRPETPVTRAEFAVLMGRIYPDAPVAQKPILFIDIPDNHWAKKDIETATSKGFFAGYPDKTFRPEQEIPRVQATIVLAASQPGYILPLNPREILQQYFDDAGDIPNYGKDMSAVAAINNIVVNYPEVRKFNPNRSATRGEIASLICQALTIPDAISSEYVAQSNLFVIPPIFASATSFSEGLAGTSIEGNSKNGFIDTTGKFAIAPNPERTYRTLFSEGLAGVLINNKGGYIDKTENIVISPQTSGFTMRKFSEELVAVQIEYEGKWGYWDKNGNLAIEAKFGRAGDFVDGIALVEIDRKKGFIDKNGDFVIEPQTYFVSDFSESMARIKIEGKWGYIDTEGNTAIPAQFEEAEDFSEGLAAVKLNNKWGYIDLDGNWVIQPQFNRVGNFSEDLAWAYKEDRACYIDKSGNVAIESEFTSLGSFSEGLAKVGMGGRRSDEYEIGDRWGFIDKKGNVVIQPQFHSVEDFTEGFALAKLSGSWEYKSIGYDSSAVPIDFIWVLQGGKYGYIYNPLL